MSDNEERSTDALKDLADEVEKERDKGGSTPFDAQVEPDQPEEESDPHDVDPFDDKGDGPPRGPLGVVPRPAGY